MKTKVFNWSEVHLYRSNFLQNPYFSPSTAISLNAQPEIHILNLIYSMSVVDEPCTESPNIVSSFYSECDLPILWTTNSIKSFNNPEPYREKAIIRSTSYM